MDRGLDRAGQAEGSGEGRSTLPHLRRRREDADQRVARAQYWLGEALTAQQKTAEAQAAYEVAARYPYVFYGQLAAEEVRTRLPEAAKLSFRAARGAD